MRIADAQKIPLSVRIFCALSTLATPADFALAAGAGSDTAVVDTDRIET